MTNIEFAEYLTTLSSKELEMVKKLIEQRENVDYDKNWKVHERKDDYLYIIHYTNGDVYYHHIAQVAYKKYLNEDDAEWIERKTKDLFPTYEFLERKNKA